MTNMDSAAAHGTRSLPLPGSEEDRAYRSAILERELTDACGYAGGAWLARMHDDLTMWSELAGKLAAEGSVPQELKAYTRLVSQRMQAAAEEGHRLFDDCERIAEKIGELLGNGEHFVDKLRPSAKRAQPPTRPGHIEAIRSAPCNVVVMHQRPHDLAKLILKLRWIGMDDEARRLELAVRSVPAEQRGTVSAGPFSTD